MFCKLQLWQLNVSRTLPFVRHTYKVTRPFSSSERYKYHVNPTTASPAPAWTSFRPRRLPYSLCIIVKLGR